MDWVQAVTDLIGNLGVPVGMCIGCFWLLNKERADHKTEVDSLRETFSKSTDEIAKAITNNTIVMESIRDRLTHV